MNGSIMADDLRSVGLSRAAMIIPEAGNGIRPVLDYVQGGCLPTGANLACSSSNNWGARDYILHRTQHKVVMPLLPLLAHLMEVNPLGPLAP